MIFSHGLGGNNRATSTRMIKKTSVIDANIKMSLCFFLVLVENPSAKRLKTQAVQPVKRLQLTVKVQ